MHAKRFLTLVLVGCSAASGAAAQGTKSFQTRDRLWCIRSAPG